MINNKVELYFSSSSIRPTLKKEKEKRLFSSTNFVEKKKRDDVNCKIMRARFES